MPPSPPPRIWSIVLAAGEGSRLRELTRDARGVAVPKQFCSLSGGPSLLEASLERAAQVAPTERTLVVVAAEHEPWWSRQLAGHPRENVVVQPRNRGTANGVLLPLLELLSRDPFARVLILPSDHHVEDEAAFAGAMRAGLAALDDSPEALVLVGVTPDAPETEYGWIVPAPAARRGVAGVAAFVEKPDAATAERLQRCGALWSSFVLASEARALLGRIESALPGQVRSLLGCRRSARLELARVYESLSSADLSRDVLQLHPRDLLVVAAPSCGWTDLGTPRRVAACLRALERAPAAPPEPRPSLRSAILDLSQALVQAAGLVPAVG